MMNLSKNSVCDLLDLHELTKTLLGIPNITIKTKFHQNIITKHYHEVMPDTQTIQYQRVKYTKD